MRASLKGTELNMLPTVIKEIVDPKIVFLSLFTHSHIVPNLYSFIYCGEHKRLYFVKAWVTNSCWFTLTLI